MNGELRLTVRGDLRELTGVATAGRSFLVECGVGESALYLADLAIEEAVSNVMRHGGVDTAQPCIAIRLVVADSHVDVHVVDPGRPFDPNSAPEPRLDAPLEERRAGGLGILLLRQLTADLHYERLGDENHLRIRIPLGPSAPPERGRDGIQLTYQTVDLL